MDYERLKTRQRQERDRWPESLSLRVHRALSWPNRAEQLGEQDDLDGQFIFLWVAFNAAYATEIDEKYRESEQQTFRAFLEKLTGLDAAQKRFDALVWTEFPKSIRVLLENRFVFADFWHWQNGSLADLRAAQPAGARRGDVGLVGQSGAAPRLHAVHGQAGAGRDRGDDGPPRDAVGAGVLSGGEVTAAKPTPNINVSDRFAPGRADGRHSRGKPRAG